MAVFGRKLLKLRAHYWAVSTTLETNKAIADDVVVVVLPPAAGWLPPKRSVKGRAASCQVSFRR